MIDPKDLILETCNVWSGYEKPKGMSVHAIPTGVRVIHIPTGTMIFVNTQRSQMKNKKLALEMLEYALVDS